MHSLKESGLLCIYFFLKPFLSICKNAILQALDGVQMTEDIVQSVIEQGKKSKFNEDDIFLSKKDRKKKERVKKCTVLGKLDIGH